MNISLTPALEEYISKKFSTGFYESESEIIREALRLLISHDNGSVKSEIKSSNDKNKIHNTVIDGLNFSFSDSITSKTVTLVSNEINYANEYDFKTIQFKEGDIVVDIGANIGMVSIYLAKKYPFLKIYSFEPVKENYENLIKNIQLNNIPEGTIIAKNMAVTKDGRNVNMSINTSNSGGSSISDVISVNSTTQEWNCNIPSITLEKIFEDNKIENLKLLKIDCEGSEYEIIKNAPENILRKIEMLRGEYHENKNLTLEYDACELLVYTKKFISDVKVVLASGCFIM